MSTRDKLVMAVTEYDRKQSTNRGYNPHALAIYLERVDAVCGDIDAGVPVRRALLGGFNDRLLDFLLRRVGEQTATIDEHHSGPLTYAPQH